MKYYVCKKCGGPLGNEDELSLGICENCIKIEVKNSKLRAKKNKIKKLILENEKLSKGDVDLYRMDEDEFISICEEEIHDELTEYCFESVAHDDGDCDGDINEDTQTFANRKIHTFSCEKCEGSFCYYETNAQHVDNRGVQTWGTYWETEDDNEEYEFELYNNYVTDDKDNKIFYTVFKKNNEVEINF